MPTLELSLPHDSLTALLRLPFLVRSGPAIPTDTVWRDTSTAALASRGEALCESQGHWRLERLHPGPAAWPAMTPAPVLAHGDSPEACGIEDPAGLGTSAGFRGQRRAFAVTGLDGADPALESVALTVTDGQVHGVSATRPVCRIRLDGDASELRGVALHLAASLPVAVPRAGLAAEALAAARGQVPPPRHLGAPMLQPDLPLSDSIATIIGQLLDVMLHWSGPAAAGKTPVPVHQMRVATRRLRSALSIFKRVAACPEVEPLSAALRDTAAQLGAARDWDVFLEGTGERIHKSFPGDPSVRAVLSAARRQRALAYVALRAHLSSTAFRELQVALGCAAALRPWEAVGDSVLHHNTAPFASAVLSHRLRKVRRAGRGLHDLPVEALHELRKDCKRLRYAAEFFQPLFPHKAARRFVQALSVLQEELGMLNDGAVASGLMAHLGRPSRSYAAGLVVGFANAGVTDRRVSIAAAWKKFKRQEPFWD